MLIHFTNSSLPPKRKQYFAQMWRKYHPSFSKMSQMSQGARESSLRVFIRVDALSLTWATRILSRAKNERFQAWAFSFWAFRNIDEIHTDLLTSAGKSRTRIGRSARLRSIRDVLWLPTLSAPSGISSQILDAIGWLTFYVGGEKWLV